MRWSWLAAGLLFVPQLAEAHLRLLEPTSRYGDEQKTGPCGRAGGVRTDNVHTFEPGQQVVLIWDEYINHPGHFRISFDADGDDDFVDPAGFDDLYSGPSVLVDDISDQATGGVYNYAFTLPDVECDNCTLQVVQVMTDKPPYGDGNDLYYQCVDLVLRRAAPGSPDAGAAAPDAGTDPMAPDAGGPGANMDADRPVTGACDAGANTTGSRGGTSALIIALAIALGVRRRRSLGRVQHERGRGLRVQGR